MKKTTNKYCIPSSKILYVDEYSTSGEYINPKAFILNKNELIIINSIFFILISQLSHIVNHKFLYKKASLNPINRHFFDTIVSTKTLL